ncbi:hypothetical protein EMMF5_005009 [Cystobasidiomycetes sp. EMM_F5]
MTLTLEAAMVVQYFRKFRKDEKWIAFMAALACYFAYSISALTMIPERDELLGPVTAYFAVSAATDWIQYLIRRYSHTSTPDHGDQRRIRFINVGLNIYTITLLFNLNLRSTRTRDTESSGLQQSDCPRGFTGQSIDRAGLSFAPRYVAESPGDARHDSSSLGQLRSGGLLDRRLGPETSINVASVTLQSYSSEIAHSRDADACEKALQDRILP